MTPCWLCGEPAMPSRGICAACDQAIDRKSEAKSREAFERFLRNADETAVRAARDAWGKP